MQKWETPRVSLQLGREQVQVRADNRSMFDTVATTPLPTSSAGPAATPARSGQLPLELEQEFAEMQAAQPNGGVVFALLGIGLLFHILLIAERFALALSPSVYAERGAPVTFLLALLLLLPASLRQKQHAQVLTGLLPISAIVALLAGLPFTTTGQLLLVQSGVASTLLLFGWLAAPRRASMQLLATAAFAADAASVLAGHVFTGVGISVALQSLWAPAFAAALLLLLAEFRHNDARREFLMLRQAAFSGVADTAFPDSRHLDPETGIANRVVFDMRFRAAWEHAETRRQSVALLFFSIDRLAEQKRDQGSRFVELLQSSVANLLKESLRRSDDMVARFDNQHFVVMLPGVGTDGATQIGERLRGMVEDMRFYAGQKRYSATVTVGGASIRAKRGAPRDQLIDAGIAALDQARCTGTNIVCIQGRGCVPRMS